MSKGIAAHLRSNVVGYVAVFIALSGTAYAVDGPLAGQDQVGSDDIINGEVRENDLHSDSVKSGKVVDDSLTADDVGTGSDRLLRGSRRFADRDRDRVRSDRLLRGFRQLAHRGRHQRGDPLDQRRGRPLGSGRRRPDRHLSESGAQLQLR